MVITGFPCDKICNKTPFTVLSGILAMNINLLIHRVPWVQNLFAILLMDRRRVQGEGMLSTYGQDDLHQSVSAAGETLAQLEFVYHFVLEVLGYL